MKGKQNTTSQLVLGAIMLAVFVVLYMVIPIGDKLVQSLLMVFSYIPITLYVINCARKYAITIVCAGIILSAFFLQPLVLIAYAIPSLLIGLVSGLTITRISRSWSIAIFSILHLLQNVFEIIFYYKMMSIDFFVMYGSSIDESMRMISPLLTSETISSFFRDLMVCSIPLTILVGAIIKGILSFWITSLVANKLTAFLGGIKIKQSPGLFLSKEKVISVTYIILLAIFTPVITAVFVGLIPYHFVIAAYSMIMILGVVSYMYYFYLIRIRNAVFPLSKKILLMLAIVVLFPMSIYILPIIDLLQYRANK